jgi:hypothetical protein
MNPVRSWMLVSVAAAFFSGLVSACSEFEVKNKIPIASAVAQVGGVDVVPGMPIPYDGAPVAVTLSSAKSKDPDGSIARTIWMRTDVSPNERYAGNGMVDGGAFGAFASDPPVGQANPVMMLGLGKHRFSLWVVDDKGLTSAPASVSLEVKVASNYMPDMACMAKYTHPNPACVECICSPMANMGCLEHYRACYESADPMFSTLCGGITSCAIAGKCVGSACYAAAPLCMAQIDAAATYMGGTLANCSMGDATSNPCRAASVLGVCTNYDTSVPPVDGPCRAACMQ